ncbi:MAG TPA: tRNA uracil 4-sulfurtransferase ThiI, partial [Planctomycetota bacterium]|nr:tRNA uracil 4-sulfurtransferase ThiI [Planctomycetota bacterium]
TLEALTATTLAVAAPLGPRRTFAVRVKKADSGYAYGASETERLLGAEVCARTDWKVDLGDPEVTLRVEIVNGKGFVAARRLDGPGGLPYGTTGHGLALISGGIDSPVAAWLMMGRGLKVSAVHFHSAPFTTAASQDKVKELLRVLTRRQPSIDAAFVPFAETVQRRIVEAAPSRYRVVLYRRFMVRIAGALAEAAGATCLVTGDALGQVASQTIANLATVDAASPLPVFRPLIGLSKERIMDEARRIGTYDVSIQPDEDCCAYLMPRDPAAATTHAELLEVEKALEVESMTRAAVLAHGSFTIRFDVAEPVPRRRR